MQAATLQEVKRAVLALLSPPAESKQVVSPTEQFPETAPVQAIAKPSSCSAANSGEIPTNCFQFVTSGNAELAQTHVQKVKHPFGQCEYYVEEPESPKPDNHPVHVPQSQLRIVQTSPVVAQQETRFAYVPMIGSSTSNTSAHVLLRTVECKPLKQGLPGATQLRLKEVYQSIDCTGNSRSQCQTRSD